VLLELPRGLDTRADGELCERVDTLVAASVRGWRAATPVLSPLPLLGVPGYADNSSASFYDDDGYFRIQRRQ